MLSSETVQSPEILGSSKYTLLCMLRDKDVVFHEQQVGFGVGVVYISSCFKKKKKAFFSVVFSATRNLYMVGGLDFWIIAFSYSVVYICCLRVDSENLNIWLFDDSESQVNAFLLKYLYVSLEHLEKSSAQGMNQAINLTKRD